MPGLTYESASVLLYDPVAGNRTATRAALYTLGFRSIDTVATLSDFSFAVLKRPPDLAVCEAQGSDIELCDTIQSLRQGVTGFNPFVVIIVTTWDKTDTLVRRILDSGADDLLLRPFSTSILGVRIETHIERRKGFVITHDYVGPDRRSDPRRPSNAHLFEPPNSLRMKVKDRLSTEEVNTRLDSELKVAKGTLNGEKVRRDAFQIGVLWRLLEEGAPDEDGYAVDLAKLARLAQGIIARLGESGVGDTTRWCESVLAATEGIEKGVDRDASMHLLGHAALNLCQAVQPLLSMDQHLAQLNATVYAIRARLSAPAKAASNG